jgi:hypothetical protein
MVQGIRQPAQFLRIARAFRVGQAAQPRQRGLQRADDGDVGDRDQDEHDQRDGMADLGRSVGEVRGQEEEPCGQRGQRDRKQSACQAAQERGEDHRRVEGQDRQVVQQRAKHQAQRQRHGDQDGRREISGP